MLLEGIDILDFEVTGVHNGFKFKYKHEYYSISN